MFSRAVRPDRFASRGSRRERLAPLASQVPRLMDVWRDELGAKLHSDEKPISVARLITEINKALPADGILVADGGFAAQ